MTVNLIPQDKLTLDLLAKVLAKMYWYSLNSKNDALTEVASPGPGASSADHGNRRQGHTTPERDLVQVEDDCPVASHSRLAAVGAGEDAPSQLNLNN